MAGERKGVFISYSAGEEEFKEKMEKELKDHNIQLSGKVPYRPNESQRQWSERKCQRALVVLALMSNDYQQDDRCKFDAETAKRLKSQMIFVRAKKFEENEWMKGIRGDSFIFDFTESKYKRNMADLIESLSDLLGSEGSIT